MLVGDNCDFPGDNVMHAQSVPMKSECSELCERNLNCTAYLVIGSETFWCVLKKGVIKLEDAREFNGTSQCGINRSLYLRIICIRNGLKILLTSF